MSAPITYRQPVSRLWWLKKRTYFLFVLRELSSIFVAWFAVFLMIMVVAIGRGEASYQNFMNWAASPVVIVINIVALAFLTLLGAASSPGGPGNDLLVRGTWPIC